MHRRLNAKFRKVHPAPDFAIRPNGIFMLVVFGIFTAILFKLILRILTPNNRFKLFIVLLGNSLQTGFIFQNRPLHDK